MATAFPEKERGQALGILGSVISAGFLAGPILGGFLVEHLGWRYEFFINLPIGVIGIFLSSKVLEKNGSARKVRLDVWGALLLFILVTALLLFLNEVGKHSIPPLWGWLFLSLLCLGLFIAVEVRSPFPLVDLSLFRGRLFISSLGASLLSFWMSGAHNFATPFSSRISWDFRHLN